VRWAWHLARMDGRRGEVRTGFGRATKITLGNQDMFTKIILEWILNEPIERERT
jgi:hypothetical protein